MKKSLLLALLTLTLFSCRDDENAEIDITRANLTGTWQVVDSTCGAIGDFTITESTLNGFPYELQNSTLTSTALGVESVYTILRLSKRNLDMEYLGNGCITYNEKQ